MALPVDTLYSCTTAKYIWNVTTNPYYLAAKGEDIFKDSRLAFVGCVLVTERNDSILEGVGDVTAEIKDNIPFARIKIPNKYWSSEGDALNSVTVNSSWGKANLQFRNYDDKIEVFSDLPCVASLDFISVSGVSKRVVFQFDALYMKSVPKAAQALPVKKNSVINWYTDIHLYTYYNKLQGRVAISDANNNVLVPYSDSEASLISASNCWWGRGYESINRTISVIYPGISGDIYSLDEAISAKLITYGGSSTSREETVTILKNNVIVRLYSTVSLSRDNVLSHYAYEYGRFYFVKTGAGFSHIRNAAGQIYLGINGEDDTETLMKSNDRLYGVNGSEFKGTFEGTNIKSDDGNIYGYLENGREYILNE